VNGGKALKAAPAIPFFGAFFSSNSNTEAMSYPDQRSDDQWRAVLNPGSYLIKH
jgi:peptide-methionine (R)-S-oxide reductase